MELIRPVTTTPCQHCKAKDSYTGTRGGCSNCGKVKSTSTGKKRIV